MPYLHKLTSLHINALMEQILAAGRIEISVAGDDVVLSKGIYALFDLEEGDMPGLDAIARAIDPADRGVFLSDLELMRRVQEPPARVYRRIQKIAPGAPHGFFRYISVQFRAISNEAGVIQKFFGVARDVTEKEIRRRATNSLSGLPLEEVAELATGATIRAACAYLGWSHERLADRAGVSQTTVHRMSGAEGELLQTFKSQSLTLVLKALVADGLVFFKTPDGLLAMGC